ncbi:hypothetical protein HPS54_12395 [Prevotella sp. PCHR]|uniref:Uncharacterized protein n=1 Tax=Xylanibacter caecicola TaxID=2736294 RepID=A0ABX2B7Q8_9BACT|nr:hypothetical protein [Xylanibacter caecicola]NPE26295.1 hypothetical protein [Xylanibacter caecicola]
MKRITRLFTTAAIMSLVATNAVASINTDKAKDNYKPTQWEYYAAAEYAGGTGTEADPYQIATPEQLAKLAVEIQNIAEDDNNWDDAYSAGKFWVLTADINMSENALAGIKWVGHTIEEAKQQYYSNFTMGSADPESYTLAADNRTFSGIGYLRDINADYQRFAGTFDGQGHTISGLINTSNSTCAIFNEINGAVIKNITVKNSWVQGNSNTSLLVAHSINSTIMNCQTSGILFAAGSYGAGIVGNLDGGKVLNCATSAWTWGKNNMGGIAGKVSNSAEINNCYFGGWTGARFWAGTKYKYTGAMSPELGYNTASEAKNCYWADTCVVRYVGAPLECVFASNSSGGIVTDCKAVAPADVANTVAALNAQAHSIAGACTWKVEDGAPVLDFSSIPTGITGVVSETSTDNRIYTVSGVRVEKATKGLYIKNGKKVIM